MALLTKCAVYGVKTAPNLLFILKSLCKSTSHLKISITINAKIIVNMSMNKKEEVLNYLFGVHIVAFSIIMILLIELFVENVEGIVVESVRSKTMKIEV